MSPKTNIIHCFICIFYTFSYVTETECYGKRLPTYMSVFTDFEVLK